MATRDIFLKIEAIAGYSPVEPDDHVSPPIQYRRDCMRNPGHEDGTIPDDEVNARRLTASAGSVGFGARHPSSVMSFSSYVRVASTRAGAGAAVT